MALRGLEVSYDLDVKFDLRDWSDQRGWFPDVKVGHLAVPEPWLHKNQQPNIIFLYIKTFLDE